jgi:hypothetical protein
MSGPQPRLSDPATASDLIALIASGMTIKAACEQIGLSPISVRRHTKRDLVFADRIRAATEDASRGVPAVEIVADDDMRVMCAFDVGGPGLDQGPPTRDKVIQLIYAVAQTPAHRSNAVALRVLADRVWPGTKPGDGGDGTPGTLTVRLPANGTEAPGQTPLPAGDG